MAKQDRSNVISGLQDAFGIIDDKDYDRLTTELLIIDKHKVARITSIKDYSPEKLVYDHYPEAYIVKQIAGRLASSHNAEFRAASVTLSEKMSEAARNGDANRIREIISACKSYENRFAGSATDSVAGEIAALFVIDEIRKL